MTSTTEPSAETPEYPMPRAQGCPFDPPPELRTLQEEAPLTRVRLWDGSTPWLVTRYAEQRAVLGDARVSADMTRPDFRARPPARPGASASSGWTTPSTPGCVGWSAPSSR